MKAAKPMPVDFELNDVDQEIALLGEAGWHTKAIARTTQMTASQAQYRLGMAGVKRKNYRDGKSEMAKFVLHMVRARHNTKERIIEARQLPETFENFTQSHVKVSSHKRKPKKGSS
jgi:hypothetical protein